MLLALLTRYTRWRIKRSMKGAMKIYVSDSDPLIGTIRVGMAFRFSEILKRFDTTPTTPQHLKRLIDNARYDTLTAPEWVCTELKAKYLEHQERTGVDVSIIIDKLDEMIRIGEEINEKTGVSRTKSRPF